MDKTIEIVLSNRIRSAEDAHGFEVELCQRTLTESGAQDSQASLDIRLRSIQNF